MKNVVPKILLIGGGVVGIFYVKNLLSKSKAGDAIETNVKGLQFMGLNIKGLTSWVKYRVILEIVNPSSEKLSFSTPYMKMFIKDKLICASAISDKMNDLLPKSSIKLNIDLQFNGTDIASVIPNLLKFIAAKVKGEPPSQEVKIVYTYESEGFGQEVTKKLMI